jgi:hypothetical protein
LLTNDCFKVLFLVGEWKDSGVTLVFLRSELDGLAWQDTLSFLDLVVQLSG